MGRILNRMAENSHHIRRAHIAARSLRRAFDAGDVAGALRTVRSIIVLYPPSKVVKSNIDGDIARAARWYAPGRGIDWADVADGAVDYAYTRELRGVLLLSAIGWLMDNLCPPADDTVMTILTDHRGQRIKIRCFWRTVPLNATQLGITRLVGAAVSTDGYIADGQPAHVAWTTKREHAITGNEDQTVRINTWEYTYGRHA